ncbi:MAG: endonuclease III [Flavobacteriales bacterium]|jgi:endonuclease-3|nr:endonuclease III [Flavobacteriales bacterium]
MKRRLKLSFITDTLEELYGTPKIPLIHQDPYTLLIAVLLSAQCTDQRVNKVTPSLFKLANTPKDMMRVSVSRIEKIIKPCGLAPTKARAISKLSEILVKEYRSVVPRTFKALESFPGVGHKTASVVMSQAFNISAFPIDTHIHRLSYRWGISNGKNVIQTEKDCKSFFPEKLWNKLHLQMIYFGREYCPARKHNPNVCPICRVVGRKTLFE